MMMMVMGGNDKARSLQKLHCNVFSLENNARLVSNYFQLEFTFAVDGGWLAKECTDQWINYIISTGSVVDCNHILDTVLKTYLHTVRNKGNRKILERGKACWV